jgi:hypothetical protein
MMSKNDESLPFCNRDGKIIVQDAKEEGYKLYKSLRLLQSDLGANASGHTTPLPPRWRPA